MLEMRYSKREILTAYLNEIYLGRSGGGNVMGMGAASRAYFGKDASQLTLAESATLAGIIPAPASYSPLTHPDRAKERRDWVLHRLETLGRIDKARVAQALATPIQVAPEPLARRRAPYFADAAAAEAETRFKIDDLADGGYSLYSTVSWEDQQAAQAAMDAGLAAAEKGYEKGKQASLQAALISIEPASGGILAYIGGRRYEQSQFDRVSQAYRQTGSAFKPIVYAAAFEEHRATPATFLEDEPLVVQAGNRDWSPKNDDGEFHGWVTVRTAIEHSYNPATTRLALQVGIPRIVALGHALGITSAMPPYPATALGATAVAPLELATVYATLAAGGLRPPVHGLVAVVDSHGKPIAGAPLPAPVRALSPQTDFLVTSLLQGVIERGTGAGAAPQLHGRLAGKTGTTNDRRDSWFGGYAPERATVVWVGYDDNAVTRLSGARAALPIWSRFTVAVAPPGGYSTFPQPPEIKTALIDPETGLLATEYCPEVFTEVFRQGEEPVEICKLHQSFADQRLEPSPPLQPGVSAEAIQRAPQPQLEEQRRSTHPFRRWLRRLFGGGNPESEDDRGGGKGQEGGPGPGKRTGGGAGRQGGGGGNASGGDGRDGGGDERYRAIMVASLGRAEPPQCLCTCAEPPGERRCTLPMSNKPAIRVVRARTHNLKGIDCQVPHRAVTVVTGPSGAGKSSLAFDTIFAEGQRRFVESMSTYARQFLDQMERPPVDAIENILPAVALEARNAVRNARSTVGTITEIHDVLRLLFTHLGEVTCPRGHGPARAFAPEEAALDLAGGAAGDSFLLVARVPRPQRAADEALAELIRQGFSRRLAEMTDGVPAGADRAPNAESAARVMATIEEAYRLTGGRVEARGEPREAPAGEPGTPSRPPGGALEAAASVRFYSRDLACPVCGEGMRRPTPPLFSFNSPLGACPACQGFGRVIGIDRQRVVPDPRRALAERPIAPWNTPAYEELYDELLAAAKRRRIPVDLPWAELPAAAREWVWSGAGKFVNLDAFFSWLEQRTYKVHVRVLLARYRSYTPCPECGGARLRPEAVAVRLDGETLPALGEMSIEQLRGWLAGRRWTARQREVAGHLLEEAAERVEVLHRVGLDYLTLNRQARTLSGGETQRIHLAAALGSGLTTTLYVLDEPTIGLHPQDSGRLLSLLRDLAARGNTVLVVEHDRTLIRGADHIIDLGPAAGERGGFVVAEGPLAAILANEDSLTGRYLRQRPRTPARQHVARFRREQGWDSLDEELEALPRVAIRGARAHNLRGIDVELPLGALVAVTGVSGSGKSTLVENVLYGTYQRARGVVDVEPGEVDALSGLDGLADVTLVDQRPLGRSSRSNPITYIKAYDEIRKLFAAAPEARARGISAAHFSFNVERGRCPACQGTGVTEVDMQFMAPVTVACDTCQGRRFRPEVLAVRWRGRTIAEALELTVEQALEVFVEQRRLCRRLRLLADVGLGYLRLGQATSTLSGGEAQRLKLASFLDRPAAEGRRLFLFDEPTTGLHLADIDVLYHTLRRLVQRGDGVVVVEHSPDLIARCDWIVDLGPGGGVHGGELLYCGPLEPFLDRAASPTADELRQHLRWVQPLALAAP